ncbi:NAD-dependent epimerase [Cytobacillus oceanisediminis]|uniref:Capsular biosynthesis protein CpsI n=1 Tax=Cytobacillus oceanisediminis 2691 TaxID=1196031 RepID=A0A160MHR5_9BACI|nr:NAD-dependent epimerase [Cytobacillus oceanisediminis]AND42258.1 capsular biosynthesis protein CpsI [Cytobacillus oceanisediminis 2691]
MTILVTGAAGFVGFHLTNRLLKEGFNVIGIDNINDYYDTKLKQDRLAILEDYSNFTFYETDLADRYKIENLFQNNKFEVVINLAAQAGVRYSLENPNAYIDSNLVGFTNILEGCRNSKVKHLLYASSSSVYGANVKMPFSVHDNVDHPVSLYAATKKANELMAHTYSHLYGIPTTGLRFFTVYGPWGRPDMAYFSFTQKILNEEPIKVFNHGKMKRDFTFIDDIVEGIVRLIDKAPQPNKDWDRKNPDPGTSYAPYQIFNIGNNKPVELMEFINTLEELLGKKANMEFLPMQAGDVEATYADIEDLQMKVGYAPSTTLKDGLAEFVKWYRTYYTN